MNSCLNGIKVLQTASAMAGPMAARLLADWGADVIQVEHPVRGDMARGDAFTRNVKTFGGRSIESNINYAWENHNCNKRCMTLDLSHEKGQQVLIRLLKKTDVFLANFRPREIKKFNLEYETIREVNPRLIYVNLTGWGKVGPDKDMPGYDFVAFWARSGIYHVLDRPDMEPPINPIGFGDRVNSLALVSGIMAALFMRERTGVGQQVDVSLYNTAVFVNAYDIGGSLVTHLDRQNVDRKDLVNALQNSYRTKEGRWLCLAITQPDLYWSKLCQALGREGMEHDPRFSTFQARIDNYRFLFQLLEEVFSGKTLPDWKTRLNEAGIPWSPVQSLPEVVSDPQARENGFFDAFEHPTYGPIEIVANPIKLSDSPSVIKRPAPEFGQHTEEILIEHGYNWEDISRLKENRIIA